MALTHIIAHHIQRTAPGNPAAVKLCEASWPPNGRIEECFRELKLAVMKRVSKEYAGFSDDYGTFPLSTWLKQYLDEKFSFVSFTQKVMEHLKVELDKTEVVIEGYMVFAHEQLEHENTLHCFWVQHNTGQYIDGDLTIHESLYLDTANISLAAKVNITDWLSDDMHRQTSAVTLLPWRGEKDLTEVFKAMIGFAEKVDISADTDEFLSAVTDYTKDLPEAVAFQTRKHVVDYCLEQDKVGKPVVIEELSQVLKDHSASADSAASNTESNSSEQSLPEFAQFVADNNPATKPELIADKSRLRQFVRISGRDDNLSMSFTSRCLGDTIVYDPATDSLTINNIPKSLKMRLAKHLQDNR